MIRYLCVELKSHTLIAASQLKKSKKAILVVIGFIGTN
jgi:hypothetical protein